MPNRRDPAQRFWEKVAKTDGCWEWIGARQTRGHGDFCYGGRQHGLAHRFSWELHFGPIPEGMNVCHRCDNPPCVRPDHLFLGTQKDNLADMAEKGRSTRGRRMVTHCKHGHEYNAENAWFNNRGGRVCPECANGRRRKGLAARRPFKSRKRLDAGAFDAWLDQ